MATTSVKNTNPYIGKSTTPVGIMPPDLVKRHKLPMNTPSDPSFRKTYRHDRKAKAAFESTKNLRFYFQGVHENRLPRVLRDGVHYLLEPLGRQGTGGGNYSNGGTSVKDNDNSLTAVQSPLMV